MGLKTTPAITSALVRFQEAAQHLERDRALAKSVRPLQREMAKAFQAQGKDFVNRLKVLAPRFNAVAAREAASVFGDDSEAVKLRLAMVWDAADSVIAILKEAIGPRDWQRLWNQTVKKTDKLFTGPLQASILSAMIFGGGQLLDELGLDPSDMDELGVSWDLKNPEALAYAKEHAGEQVAKINDVTRAFINTIISRAVDEGWSFARVSKNIRERFDEFATGGSNPRSRRIAIFELGDAYEAATEVLGGQLIAAGLEMEKKWLTVGDSKVRPSHTKNQRQGYIPFDDDFSSGDGRPPTDPG